MTETIIIGRKPRRSRPPTIVRPPTSTGQATLLDVTGAHEDNSASLAITMPDYATGDLVLMQVQGSQSNDITTPADFTALEENYEWGQTGGSVSWMYFVADGTQDSQYTISLSGAGKCTAIAWAVRGGVDWDTYPPEIGTSVKGTDQSPDPPTVTPSHGDGEYWIFPAMATNIETHNSAPSGYTLHKQESQGDGQTDLTAYVWRQLVSVTTSENPGTASLSGNATAPRWGGNTIAVLAESAGTVAAGDHTHFQQIAYADTGTLAVTTGASPWPAPYALTVLGVRAAVGTAPTGASIIVDVNKGGTTMFTTQGNRPTIAASGTSSSEAVPDVTTVSEGDLITVDIDQVGSSTEGSDLVVVIRYKQ